MKKGNLDISWKGHATIEVEDNDFKLFVDPFQIDGEADLVLITHSDLGHFDTKSLKGICREGTCVIIPESIDKDSIPCRDVEKISENEKIDVFGITVESVPMDNDSHLSGNGSGYLFQMDGTSIYVAGDTGLMNEARDLEGRVDLAFLPVNGGYTMEAEDAVKMAVKIKPSTVIPYHYGEGFPNSSPDLRFLKAELEDRNIECRVLENS